jgi:hypothetical protein
MPPKFGYQREKFYQARSCLLLPENETSAIASAFEVISRCLHQFDTSKVQDDNALEWLKTVHQTMDTTGLTSPNGLWLEKAAMLTTGEKREFARAVDELASWFDWQDRND